MRSASRLAMLFGLPAVLLLTVSAIVWLALGSGQTGFGPMRLTPLPLPALSSPTEELDPPPPTQLEQISPLQARLRNALLPYTRSTRGVAYAYHPTAESPASALDCLTQAVYYEAAREPEIGKRAVAQVIVNRASSSPFPNTICGVVQQGAPRPGCQFTFMCDGSLARRPDPALWAAARNVAERALKGETEPTVGDATHYHAQYVFPTWAPTMAKLVQIGAHIFYRWRAASYRAVPPPLTETPSMSAIDALGAPSADAVRPVSTPPAPEPSVRSDSAVAAAAATSPGPQEPSPGGAAAQASAPASALGPARPHVSDAPELREHPRRAIPERPLGSSPLL